MQKRKLFLLTVFFLSVLIGAPSCFTNHSRERDTNVIRLNFETNEYEKLILQLRCGPDSTFYFSGTLNDGSWILKYPRRLYEKCRAFCFFISPPTDTIRHSISFNQIIDNDTLMVRQYMFDDVDTVTINAGLKIETKSIPNTKPVILYDVYFLNNMPGKEYLTFVELYANEFFITGFLDTDYNEIVNQFAKTVQKYPDSHSLIVFLNDLKRQYYVKDNVQKIYNNFSDRQKQSCSGVEIQKFLSDTVFYFKNALLPAWDTEKPEPIIKDFSKINLVIFSASWCGPCRAEIPILKKIAGELGDKIAMVYISMDKTTTVDAWKKLMIDQKITWRSVLAANSLEEINKQFFNPEYPTVLMVYPDGKYEEIEVRYDADLKKLYEVVGKQ